MSARPNCSGRLDHRKSRCERYRAVPRCGVRTISCAHCRSGFPQVSARRMLQDRWVWPGPLSEVALMAEIEFRQYWLQIVTDDKHSRKERAEAALVAKSRNLPRKSSRLRSGARAQAASGHHSRRSRLRSNRIKQNRMLWSGRPNLRGDPAR